jgi:hypothetical protein
MNAFSGRHAVVTGGSSGIRVSTVYPPDTDTPQLREESVDSSCKKKWSPHE